MPIDSRANLTYVIDLQTCKTYEDVGGKQWLSQMGVSFAALLNHETDEIRLYTEKDIDVLLNEITSAQLIVGFNLRKFVYKVLSGFCNYDFENVKSLDILENIRKKIVHKPSIDDLFSGTLGIYKSVDNMKITRIFKEGKIEQVKQIIIENVRTYNSAYTFGKQKGYVFLNDQTGQRWKISVAW